MRFLYGDSVPFPPQYDFLAALEAFCTHASRVVRLDAECGALRKAAEEGAAKRTQAVEELERFHREAIAALKDGAKETTQPLVHDYVSQVADLAQSLAEAARRSAVQTSDREAQQTRAEHERRRAEVRDALEKLFIAVRLPVTETQVTMNLVEGKNEMSATSTHEGELLASFTLSAEDVEEWRAPRHVRDLAENVSLPVGVKRSLFKRTVAPETIVLDELVLGGFDLRDDRAEIRLRRKAEHGDSLVFSLRRSDDELTAEVHYPDDAEAESGLPAALDRESAVELERMWQLLRAACAPVLARKKRLTRLTLAGASVFEEDLGAKVVSIIVRVIAPIVLEIAKRSPNAQELSLKTEKDSGRREEIYLRKAQLVEALSSVGPEERAVFEPLGLTGGSRDPIESLTDAAVLAE